MWCLWRLHCLTSVYTADPLRKARTGSNPCEHTLTLCIAACPLFIYFFTRRVWMIFCKTLYHNPCGFHTDTISECDPLVPHWWCLLILTYDLNVVRGKRLNLLKTTHLCLFKVVLVCLITRLQKKKKPSVDCIHTSHTNVFHQRISSLHLRSCFLPQKPQSEWLFSLCIKQNLQCCHIEEVEIERINSSWKRLKLFVLLINP